MRPHLLNAAVIALIVAAATGCAGHPEANPSFHTIRVGKATLEVEAAADPASRAKGLSGRRELPEGRGMLFIFPQAEVVSFWMKDTYIPLSIAFITSDGKITEIQDMRPESLAPHSPRVAVVMTLEVNAGWFERNGVAAGDTVQLPPSLLSMDAK